MHISTFSSSILAALVFTVGAKPTAALTDVAQSDVFPTVEGTDTQVVPHLITVEEFKKWLATTDADITFIGAPIGGIGPRSAQDTIVTYCNRRINNVCGGSCTVYNGGPRCLNAPDTQCLSATRNVGFCDRGGCGGSCNQFSTCGTRLDNNFCYTPGTRSILVGA